MNVPVYLQDAAPLKDTGKVSVTYKLKGKHHFYLISFLHFYSDMTISVCWWTFTFSIVESDEKGRYDIFTAQKSSRYLIYGWVALTHITSDEVILRQVFNGNSRKIQKKESAKLVSFFNHTLLFNQTRISIYFNASCTDNLFHVHELWTSWSLYVKHQKGLHIWLWHATALGHQKPCCSRCCALSLDTDVIHIKWKAVSWSAEQFHLCPVLPLEGQGVVPPKLNVQECDLELSSKTKDAVQMFALYTGSVLTRKRLRCSRKTLVPNDYS